MKTVTIITFGNSAGELDRVELSEVDATDYAIAEAAISLIERAGHSMGEGDVIRVREEQRPARSHGRFILNRGA